MEFSGLDHVFFVLIAVILPVLSLLRGKVDMEDFVIPDKRSFYYINGGVLWVGAFIVAILWLISGRSWLILGVNWPILSNLVIALTLMFVVAHIIDVVVELKHAEDGGTEEEDSDDGELHVLKTAPFLPTNYREYFHFSFLAISAGICEEVVYRGFLVNYLYAQFIDPGVAYNVSVVLPAVLFGVVHIYQGKKEALKISVMALLFGTIFIFSESLLIVVLLHIAVDLIGGFIGLKINQSQLVEQT